MVQIRSVNSGSFPDIVLQSFRMLVLAQCIQSHFSCMLYSSGSQTEVPEPLGVHTLVLGDPGKKIKNKK